TRADRPTAPSSHQSGLVQPTWFAPEENSFAGAAPLEPEGPAFLVDDSRSDVELATVQVEEVPSRATQMLVEARDRAIRARSVGDLNDVVEQCQQALAVRPNMPTAAALTRLAAWAYNRRGELLAEAGDEHSAFEQFQQAIELDPDCSDALHNRGVTLARYSRNADALADFNRVIALSPGFAIALHNRGEILSQLGRWQEAVDDYTAAIDALPDDATLYAARGHAWRQLGKTTEAASDYGVALRLDGTLADAYAGRGNLFAEQGYFEQAVEDYKQALQFDARSATTYRSVAWLLSTCPRSELRSKKKGIEAAERARKLLGDDNPVVLDTLAAAYANAGQFREAITYEQRAIVLIDAERKQAYEYRLALYRKGRPYRTGNVGR
ncbi:MAG: tetratricopeptide repeat protein, partial [Aeoliella sp.]